MICIIFIKNRTNNLFSKIVTVFGFIKFYYNVRSIKPVILINKTHKHIQ
jgi:hypothetical protein